MLVADVVFGSTVWRKPDQTRWSDMIMGAIIRHGSVLPPDRPDQFGGIGQRVGDGAIFAQVAMQEIEPLVTLFGIDHDRADRQGQRGPDLGAQISTAKTARPWPIGFWGLHRPKSRGGRWAILVSLGL